MLKTVFHPLTLCDTPLLHVKLALALQSHPELQAAVNCDYSFLPLKLFLHYR